MSGLARKILIFAAVDGLILEQRGKPSTKITYQDSKILQIPKDVGHDEGTGKSFEAYGLVGLLTFFRSSFLISIIERTEVAQIQGKSIYVITEVAITPLSSKAEAESSIASTHASLQKKADGEHVDESDTDGEETGHSMAIDDDVEDESMPAALSSVTAGHRRKTSVAEDVMSRKGGYGRFAQKWFSKKGWTADQRRNLGMTSSEPNAANPDEPVSTDACSLPPLAKSPSLNSQKSVHVAESLLPKLLRTTAILFGTSHSFYFSYDYDLTRSFAARGTSSPEVPLHTRVDPIFWWNRNLMQPFVDSGHSSLVMPLIQGFIGQKSFEMDPHPALGNLSDAEKSSLELVDLSASASQHGTGYSEASTEKRPSRGSISPKQYLLTLISRRSVKRGGLRYLRRGVDSEGCTANSVETEQVLSDLSWKSKVYSFVQIRGSIPVFFSQSPYSFKPIPQLQHSEDTNFQAFKQHFQKLADSYGSIQVVSLVEKHSAEAIVGDRYEKFVNRMNSSDEVKVGFEWFDFHAICRGMKFENVDLLMDILGKKLDCFGETVEVDGKQLSRQRGIIRTNCMDCLDRTNVVQSACGMRALDGQLKNEGIDMSLQPNQTTEWFNFLWADNGDAISKQYASTAALKGDFTRTRKRNLQGAINDIGNSISRYYSGIVNDYFSQTAIDFLLGNVTSVVFEDFEANMMSSDPGVSMQKMRQRAIETCQKLVVADEQEELIGGWTLLTPHLPNTVKSLPFEELVLLLTDTCLYFCRFDWDMEKISSFQRLDLQHITSIKCGAYITSTLSAAQADEKRNVGLVIEYKAGVDDVTRVNTRSMSNIQSRDKTDLPDDVSVAEAPSIFKSLTGAGAPVSPEVRILALKALNARPGIMDGNQTGLSEIEQVKTICSDIERMILRGYATEADAERKPLVESGDIISLSEAKKSTGLLEQLSYSLKKLVWA
ncbi:SacI domain protein [Diplocarpon rosae]|nr:SacI domain protein [Diplocarpon rosae]